MLFASGHNVDGSLRRFTLRSIQSIDPWRPPPRNCSRRAPARGGALAPANLTVSKPSARARAEIASRNADLEIELCIGGRRRLARHPVRKQTAKRGPRFDPHIPFRGGGMFRPRNFSEIVQR